MVCQSKKLRFQDEEGAHELKSCQKCSCIKPKKKKRTPRNICCRIDIPENQDKPPCDRAKKKRVKKPQCNPCKKQQTLLAQAMRKDVPFFQRCACLYQINTDALFEKYNIHRYTTPGINIFEAYLPPEEPAPLKKKDKNMTKTDPKYADKATTAKSEDNKTGADFYKSLPNQGRGEPFMPKEGRLMGVSQRHIRCFLNNEHHLYKKMKSETEDKNRAYMQQEIERNEEARKKNKAKSQKAGKNQQNGGNSNDSNGESNGSSNGSSKGGKRKSKKKSQTKTESEEIDYLEYLNTNFEACNRRMLSATCQNIIQKCMEADTCCGTDEEKLHKCLEKCPCCLVDTKADKPVEQKRKKKSKKA